MPAPVSPRGARNLAVQINSDDESEKPCKKVGRGPNFSESGPFKTPPAVWPARRKDAGELACRLHSELGGRLIFSPEGGQSQHRNESLAGRYHQGVKPRRPNGREVPGIGPLPAVGRADPLADRESTRTGVRRALHAAGQHSYADEQQHYADDQTHEGIWKS